MVAYGKLLEDRNAVEQQLINVWEMERRRHSYVLQPNDPHWGRGNYLDV